MPGASGSPTTNSEDDLLAQLNRTGLGKVICNEPRMAGLTTATTREQPVHSLLFAKAKTVTIVVR